MTVAALDARLNHVIRESSLRQQIVKPLKVIVRRDFERDLHAVFAGRIRVEAVIPEQPHVPTNAWLNRLIPAEEG
jgi:hypothetical protein